jgi:hypothetical protein
MEGLLSYQANEEKQRVPENYGSVKNHKRDTAQYRQSGPAPVYVPDEKSAEERTQGFYQREVPLIYPGAQEQVAFPGDAVAHQIACNQAIGNHKDKQRQQK